MRYLFFLVFFLAHFHSAFSQEKTISLDLKNVPLTSLIEQLESVFDIRFSYSDSIISQEKISLQLHEKSFNEVIRILNKRTTLSYEPISQRNIIIRQKTDNLPVDNIHILNEIVLKNYITNGIHKQDDGSYYILPKKQHILPGITEPDLFQTIQLLPGVVSLEETSTDIHVRGGSPDQNLILWDGIKIYHSGHLFGTFSAFNPYITKEITFINKGTNARYGDRISSVIDIQTNNEIAKKTSGGFGFNMIETDAFLEIPVVKNKFSILVSARRSFTDILLTNTYMKLSEKVFQNETTNSILKGDNNFFYYDYSFKGNWKISDKDQLNFSFLKIENELETIFEDDENDIFFKDQLETENNGYSLSWKKNWNSKINHQVNAYYSDYTLNLFQKIEAENNPDSSTKKSNIVNDAGLNFILDYNISSNQNIFAGYQFSNNHIQFIRTNQLVKDPLSSDRTLNTHALYASYHFNKSSLFNIIAGVRINYYASLQKFEIEPRLNINKKITPHWNINFTVERKTQAVSQITETINSGLSLENQIWTISNTSQIPVMESMQFSGGLTYSKNNWNIELDAYFKEIEGLTTLQKTFIDIDEFQFSQGESTVYGLDFYIKKRFQNYFTWISYTFNQVENHFEEINENQSFPANTDITHNFYWSHSYNFKNFEFALGWRWHTGKPYSKAIEIDKDQNGLGYLVYDGINNFRLPDYHRVDFSTLYNFKINHTFHGKAGISVLNLLDKENILNRKYSLSNRGKDISTIDTYSIQRVFNLVLRIFW